MDPEPGPDGDPAMQPDRLSVKCAPEFAPWSRNKPHWVSDLGAVLPEELAEELPVDSYDLVVDPLPRATRPLGLPAAPSRRR